MISRTPLKSKYSAGDIQRRWKLEEGGYEYKFILKRQCYQDDLSINTLLISLQTNTSVISVQTAMEKRRRIAEIFRGMVKNNEDEIIWALSANKDLVKEEFGFGEIPVIYYH